MYHRHSHENRYCNQCRQTTSHAVEKDCHHGNSFKCQRCGTEQKRTLAKHCVTPQDNPLITMIYQSW